MDHVNVAFNSHQKEVLLKCCLKYWNRLYFKTPSLLLRSLLKSVSLSFVKLEELRR